MSSQEPISQPEPGVSVDPLQQAASFQQEDGVEGEPSKKTGKPWVRKPYPLATFAIAFVLVAAHVVQEALGASASFWALENLGQDRSKIWEGELWRLLSCSFLHAHWLHLGCNLMGIILFGKAIERWLGPWRYLACYLTFALLGSLTYQAVASGGIGIGASGALCGLLGMYLACRMGRKEDGHLELGLRFYCWLLVISSLFLFESFIWESSGVDIADSAHFGGLFSGVFAALFFFSRPPAQQETGMGRKGVVVVTVCVFTFCLGVYGIACPFMDWSWQLWRSHAAQARGDADAAAAGRLRARSLGGDRAGLSIVVQEAEAGRPEEAIRYWESQPLEDPELQAEAGFSIYDAVYFERGYCEEVELLLDRLIELVDAAMGEKGESLPLLNQAAWFRALRGKDLGLALTFARKAHALECRNQAVLNTLGWVHFQRSETKEAFEFLRSAVSDPDYLDQLCDEAGEEFDLLSRLGLRSPSFPPNYAAHNLYLALAYWEIGQQENSREMIRRVHQHSYGGRMLLRHERRLLGDLEETLGNSLRGPSGFFQRRPSPFRR